MDTPSSRRPRTLRHKITKRSGLALIEIAVAMPIVLIALGIFAQMLTAGVNLREVGSDEWASSSAAQDVVESMRNEDFRDIFRLYNEDPFDDPSGPGTAPGNVFVVRGLIPLADAENGTVGEILLPALNAGTEVSPEWHLREDQPDDELGTPRDLNGDSLIDDLDHSGDYTILPVLVRLRWQGSSPTTTKAGSDFIASWIPAARNRRSSASSRTSG